MDQIYEDPIHPKPPTASFPDEYLEPTPSSALTMTKKDLESEDDEDVCSASSSQGSCSNYDVNATGNLYFPSFSSETSSSPNDIVRPRKEPEQTIADVHNIDDILKNNADVKKFYRQSDSLNSELSTWSTIDGSQTNLGFTDTEPEGSSLRSGWLWHDLDGKPRNSKSFIDRTKRFVRRSKDRLSLKELSRSRLSMQDLDRRQPRFIKLTDPDEPKKRDSEEKSSRVSLPLRPISIALASSSSSSRRSLRAAKTSSTATLPNRPWLPLEDSTDDRSLRTRYDAPSSSLHHDTSSRHLRFDDHINIWILP